LPEARRLGIPAQRFAAESGEEYELLVALPETFSQDQALALQSAVGLPLTRVGQVVPGAGVRAELAGAAVTLAGYDHFAGPPG
jgi:thiamine monophosphate kinase